MHKGDIDAAISRYKDAIRLRSNFAKPRLLLAEAYEKKHDKVNALKYYKEYLEVFPKASGREEDSRAESTSCLANKRAFAAAGSPELLALQHPIGSCLVELEAVAVPRGASRFLANHLRAPGMAFHAA